MRAARLTSVTAPAPLPAWRDPARYPAPDASLLAFAWQFLRRNPRYCFAWRTFAADFGLRVPHDPAADEAPADDAWCDGWDPPPGLLALVAGNPDGATALAVAELQRQARAAELARLVGTFGPLRIGNPARLVAFLRAHDARTAGAGDPAIAEVLFPAFGDAHAYPYSTARERARHAWRSGARFVAGRYRLLALARLSAT